MNNNYDFYRRVEDSQLYNQINWAKSQLMGYKYNLYRIIELEHEKDLLRKVIYEGQVSSPRWEEASLAACQKGTPTYTNLAMVFLDESEKYDKEIRECEAYCRKIETFLKTLSEEDLSLICDRFDLGYTYKELSDKYYSSMDTCRRRILSILRNLR